MGLREINATRTKKMIVDAAMELFFEHGYDGTTMEDIAQSADIGTSTLYRYFPTKESVIVGFLGDPGVMADEVLLRPADQPVEDALGHVLVEFVLRASEDERQGAKFSEVVEANPRPRARLLEWLQDAQAQLIAALAERTGRPADDIHVAAMAWMAIFVLSRITETGAAEGGARPVREVAADVMALLAASPVPTPTFTLP